MGVGGHHFWKIARRDWRIRCLLWNNNNNKIWGVENYTLQTLSACKGPSFLGKWLQVLPGVRNP